ncbi:hypothetical protein O181_000367 [Austropuccinia psidii MF-1]|uniref:HECT-type E3 ubiquitin transferase n=1 Tax=Austropuccinia psidii MF-1 TaxID=1389203 RepID=A0A9Q3B8Q9_9BASI|nr:hypothetical protein [Austropuccinia psidii MF-1]
MFWIPVLNRFDAYFESTIKNYALRGPGSKKDKDPDGKEIKEDESTRIGVQINEFTPMTKRMALATFGFIKLLLENCTNRKLFSSYDRLNDFLLTTDTDILLANLRLILRSAQQWSAQHTDINSGFGISHTRLLDLLQTWSSIGGSKTANLSFVQLVQQSLSSSSSLLPPTSPSPSTEDSRFDHSSQSNPSSPEVLFQFYRKAEPKTSSHPQSSNDLNLAKSTFEDKGKAKEISSYQPSGSSQVAHPFSTPKARSSKEKSSNSQLSPTQPNTSSLEGLTTIHIPASTITTGSRAQDILADLVEEYSLPIECRFKLFHRIRIAMALGNQTEVRKMAVIRLLALAIYTHTTDEATAISKLFIYEPGLIAQLSELINLEIHGDGIAGEIQAAAFYALEGISRYRGRIAEVAGSVGVSVSHGILMQVIRKMAKELERERARCTDEFIDSLFCFLSCLQLSAYAGSLLVGAGIVPVLVEICKNSHPKHISTVTRAVTNLDGLMYGFSSAFGLFNQVDGLKVFVNRIKEEVDQAIANHPIESSSSIIKASELLIGMLPHSSAGLLKALFRSIQRLLTSAGTLESVRNLTETQLPLSIKLIIQHKAVFGYQIYSLAINMMSTLIHSEPTSLVILQEAGLPEALYDAIDGDIEPAFDVIAAIPSALGALCLNEVGLKQLNERKAIQAIFSVFTREKHARILRDRDHASVVGSTIDELIRHQPSLKKTVLESTMDFLNEIARLGKTIDLQANHINQVQLKCCSKGDTGDPLEASTNIEPSGSNETNPTDVVMNEAQSTPNPTSAHLLSHSSFSITKKDKEKDEKEQYLNNTILLFIDVACRLLESMLQNVAHCQDFISMGALDVLLDLLRSPTIPYDFATTPAAEAFASAIRVLTETLPKETLTVVMKQLRADLIEIKPFWKILQPQAQTLDMISPTPSNVEQHNLIFRRFISIQAYISLLSDICVASGYAHTRAAAGILGVFNNAEESETISFLGSLQRVVFWEHILLKAHAPKPWSENSNTVPNASSGVVSLPVLPRLGTDSEMDSITTITTNVVPNTEAVSMSLTELPGAIIPRSNDAPTPLPSECVIENAKALRSIIARLSQSLNPFFSAIIKLLSSRRSQDDSLKKQAMDIAGALAQVLLGHLVWPAAVDPFSNFAYLTVCLNTATLLLTEERGNRTTLNSLILSPFYDAGGLQTILSLFGRYVDQTDLLTKEDNRNPSQNVLLVHLYGGLKVALDLLQTLCSSTALLESPHTVLLQSWKDLVDPPFDAPGLLISMRARILADIQRLWRAEWLTASPPNVVRGVVKILLDIIKADGETSPEPLTTSSSTVVGGLMGTTSSSLDRIAGALGGGASGLSGSGYLASFPLSGGRTSVVPDESRVTSLTDMGFPRSACETALARTHNNLNLATEFLLASPVLVQRARDEEAVAAAAEAALTVPSSNNPTTTTDEQGPTGVDTEFMAALADSQIGGTEYIAVPADPESEEREYMAVPADPEPEELEYMAVPADPEPEEIEYMAVPADPEPEEIEYMAVPADPEPEEIEYMAVPADPEPEEREYMAVPADSQTGDEVMGTPRQASDLIIESSTSEVLSETQDIPMAEASRDGSNRSEGAQPDVEDANSPADRDQATPKANSVEVAFDSPSNKTSRLDEIRAQMKTALGELRDPLRAIFLKRSLLLAESYEELAFDLKTAFKAFENKSFNTTDNNTPFDGIAMLLGELQRLLPQDPSSATESSANNLKAISVRLRVLALLANDSAFETSLQKNAPGLMTAIISLLRSTPLPNELLEASDIPTWTASALLVVEAILAYSKSKPATDVPAIKPTPEELDENDEDEDEDDDNDIDDVMGESTNFLGFPVFDSGLLSTRSLNLNSSDLAQKSSKSSEISTPIPAPAHSSTEDLDLLFRICTNLLKYQKCGRHDFLAAIRVLLILTQDHSVAEAFLSSGAPAILLRSFSFKTETRGCLPYAAMLLRHTVESHSVKKAIMTKEIIHFITSHSRHRQSDLPSFCRQIAPMAWRDWSTLMESITSTCKLIPNAGTGGSWLISLTDEKDQKNQQAAKKSHNATLKIPSAESGGADMQVDEAIPPAVIKKHLDDEPWRPAVDGTMQFLMSELLKAGRDCLAPSAIAVAATSPNLLGIVRPPIFSQASQATGIPIVDNIESSLNDSSAINSTSLVVSASDPSATKADKADEQQVAAFSHACFIMSWMSELLASYNECKISFMSLHHRKGKSPVKPSSSTNFGSAELKSRHEILGFMLCDLIPTGPLSQPNTTESQKKSAIASWAIMVLVALCHEPNAGKEPSEVVTSVRSFVLDGLAKAIQDAVISEEPVDTRYGRLYALSDLSFRLLTAAPFAQRPSSTPSDAPMQIAKIMLEKNFAALLSNALADVDLNFPSIQRLLNSILRPLEHLTKAVTKISRATTNDKKSAEGDLTSNVEVESVASESSVGDDEIAGDEEDPPDLYRNSALGLYEGELEPGNRENSPNTSEEEDNFDDEDADMDDLDDGALLGGSDLSDASDEDGDVTVEMVEADTDTSEGDHDEDDEDDEDDDEDEDEDDDHDDDEDDDDVHDDDEDDTDLEIEIAEGGVGNTIVMPQSLENPSSLEEEARNLMNFLNAGAPDLGLQAGSDQVIPTGEDGGDLEDNLEDEDGASIADQAHAADDAFEAGSLDFGDDVVVEASVGENRVETTPWSWNGVLPFQPRGEIQTGTGGMRGHHSFLHQATDNVFGRPRAGHQNLGITTHPLLVEDSTVPTREVLTRTHRRMDLRSGSVDQWITAIENLLGGGAGQLIEHILGTVAYGQRPIHIDLGQGPNGPSLGGVVIDPQRGVVMPVGPQGLQSSSNQSPPTSRLDRHLADRVAGQTLMPLATLPRWSEEARVFHQNASSVENPGKIQRAIIGALVPRAKQESAERERLAKLVAEERRLRENERTKEATSAPSANPATSSIVEEDSVLSTPVDLTGIAESLALVNASTDEPMTPLPSGPSQTNANEDSEMQDGTDDTEATQIQSDSHLETNDPVGEIAMQGVDTPGDVVEVINLARQLADRIGSTVEATSESEGRPQSEPISLQVPAANDSTSNAPQSATEAAVSNLNTDPPAASSSAVASSRVTIMINGTEVDITDTGIDPTFLEALPDDMREEVLNQHFREQRPIREELSVPVPSSISTDFLDALPPEIRAEVLRSEAADQERRRREEDLTRRATTATNTRSAAESSEVDPAAFLASLDPSLREAVLLEQDESFISTLPSNLLAEVDALRDRVIRRQHAVRSTRDRDPLTGLPLTSVSPITSASKKTPVKVDAVQILDRSGIAALVRLMFFPQPLRRHSLQKVLVNLCENSRSRTELISTLLGLLQDGTRDAATIDRSFSQVSSRASKALTPATPKSASKLRRETHVGPLPQFPGESVPNLIALRCLEALSLLVTANDRVPIYFLTEQEVPIALHKRTAKKGKGKEKGHTSVTYPIVGLLALLDRTSLLKQPNLTESITSLLALIGRPLTALAKRLEENKSNPSVTASSAPAIISTSSTNTTQAIPETNAGRGNAPPPPSSGAAGPSPSSNEKSETPSNALDKAPNLGVNDLRMIVNVLDSGECSSKTFSHTVTFIQAISTIPNGREVIAAELVERAKYLGNVLLPDLDELALAIQEAPNAAEVRSTTLAKFSSASAQQAKLLRILKTTEFLDAHAKKDEGIQLPLVDPTSPLTMTCGETASSVVSKMPPEITSPGIRFKSLWEKLSECLTLIQEREDMIHIATVLLPLMESFLVVCKHAGVCSIKTNRGSMSPRPDEATSDIVTGFFLPFTERHRKVLNTMVRNNPGLMSGSFSILVHNPKVLEFDNKRNFFSQQLHKARAREQYGNVQLNVRRPHVFEDSFHSLARRTGDELKYGKLSVRFYDEEGVDAGGVTREWLTILVKQMLDPNYALFTGSAADSKTYQPNRASSVNPDHLGFFTFCGRVIGKALYDGRVVDAYFTLAFYKHLLGISVGLNDLESVDPDHHRSLKWMLENDIDGIFELTFSVEADDFGSTRIVELKPGGHDIPVTNENKAEYVQLLVQNRLTISIQEQIDAFKKGFDEIIPPELVRIFSATELQLLLNGLPDINVEDWRANTELHQFQQSDSTVTWFWRAVRSFDQEERAKLLQFATGSSRVPLEGFGSLQGAQGATKFSLVNAHTKNVLPSAHTCFNQIDLPSYDSYEELRRMLLLAINEGSEGFGFA